MSKVLTRLQDSITDRPCGFITEWEINGGDRSITLPLYNSGVFDCVVDWGDGTTSTITSWDDVDKTHVYAEDRRYRVEITGDCPAWSFNNTGSKDKITAILNWGHTELFSGFSYLKYGFLYCINLRTMPFAGSLISNGLKDLDSAFEQCINLKNISIGIFDLCLDVDNLSFYQTFYNCYNLKSIPIDLFRFNINSLSFYQTFHGCNSLSSIPNNLFKYNTLATSFMQTFRNCNRLKLNKYIFFDIGEESFRFLNKSVNFTGCFSKDVFYGIQGEAPELWNCNFGTGTPVKTGCFSGAGNSDASIANYNDIPVDWK